MLLTINEECVSERHICWLTKPVDLEIISLHEVIERQYPHPDYNGCQVPVIEIKLIGEAPRSSEEAATWVLLEASQRAIKNISEISS